MTTPPPIPVELVPHDPGWSALAAEEAERISVVLAGTLIVVHHIGSTAIPGIAAKPILDLLPVVSRLTALDTLRPVMESLGYQWWGELGLPGRRYCTKNDPASGKRCVQLHAYEAGSPEIVRHLAFRDYLRAHPQVAQAYEEEKRRCQCLHAYDSHAYSDCKNAWIKRVEAVALASLPAG